MTKPHIQGGSCEILPVQCCIAWAAYREGRISWLAFKVWCALWLIEKSRCKPKKEGKPYRYQKAELQKFFPTRRTKTLDEALRALESAGIARFTDTDISFTEHIDDMEDAQVKNRAYAMFDQLHRNNRDKRMKFPRRILKLIIQSGQQVVRVATLLGLLLRIMLVKQYDDYRGCVKAEWIANLFGVSRHRVKTERTQLIHEGLFRRLPTSQHVRQQYGEWVALHLVASETTAPVENPTDPVSKVKPSAPDIVPKVEPPSSNQLLPSPEGIFRNQTLTAGDPKTGASQPQTLQEPTWINIVPEDLTESGRSMALFQQTVDRKLLTHTIPDRINFFAAIEHTKRVATTNPSGLLRVIVERGLWHHLTNAAEDAALRRLDRNTASHVGDTLERKSLIVVDKTGEVEQDDDEPIVLSDDAVTVQILTEDLKRAGVTGEVFHTVQRQGYLPDWTRARWEQAELAVAHARGLRARQKYQAMAPIT